MFNILTNLFRPQKQKQQSQKTNSKPKNKSRITPERTGALGEYKIDIQLDQLPEECKHLNDVLLPNAKSTSGYSQIDHILITPFGIYIIETKNYQGTIYGGKNRKTWLINGKFKMMNPFFQNYGHIEACKPYVPSAHHDEFVSIVSFTKRATFKAGIELRDIKSSQLLIYDIELSEFIKRKMNVIKIQKKEACLTTMEIEELHRSLVEANITDPAIRNSHVDNIKNKNNHPKETCAVCRKEVSKKVSDFCHANSRFNGEVYCYEHQKTL